MVVDCFPFLNESDLVELRLNELWSVVDKFFLVEGIRTFSNKAKPLNYDKDRFKPYSDKLEYVVMDDYTGINMNDSWAMEHAQKEFGYHKAVQGLSTGDVVIVSDCDEIPKRTTIESLLEIDWHMATLEMPLYYYWMNCQWTEKKWRFAKAIRLNGNYVEHEKIRYSKHNDIKTENSGWHFSYLSDIRYKIGCSAHVELNKPPYNEADHIEKMVESKQDLFGRRCRLEIVSDLSYLPKYVHKHPEIYGKYLK